MMVTLYFPVIRLVFLVHICLSGLTHLHIVSFLVVVVLSHFPTNPLVNPSIKLHLIPLVVYRIIL